MNERIQQLANKAVGKRSCYMIEAEYIKFAELIVKECMSIVSKSGNSKAEVLNDLEEFIWGKQLPKDTPNSLIE